MLFAQLYGLAGFTGQVTGTISFCLYSLYRDTKETIAEQANVVVVVVAVPLWGTICPSMSAECYGDMSAIRDEAVAT